jgi:hypothetical protein
MLLSDEREKTMTDLLNDIFDGDNKCKKKSSIPKIIFVDTCHGDARNHLDVFPHKKPDANKNQAKGTIEIAEPADESKNPSKDNILTGKPPLAAGIGNQQGTKIPQNLENFIIIHASVQQNSAWQSDDGSGSQFLPGL